MTDRVGQQIGNFHIVKFLGEGGFADVYLGQHRYLQSYAALKVSRKTLNEDDKQQFLTEAQTLVRLRHSHIVRVLDFAVEQDRPVLIMEYAPHGTLRDRYPYGTCLPLATVADYIMQVASALQYAHNHQVIHRDVKPGNILLDADSRLLISDFGLSLFSPSSELLHTQAPAGTVPYTAPEQLRGKPTFASDQYSLGIIAYEWLCGRRPFEGKAMEIMYQHTYEAPPPLRTFQPELPVAVETVVLRALAKNPIDRFPSVQAFAQALERARRESMPGGETESQITASLRAVSQPFPHPNGQRSGRDKSVPTGGSNRQRLLSKVRAFWITGVLEHSLHGAALITLGLSEQPQAVTSPWRLVLQQSNLTPQRLPSSTRIIQVYDDVGGELLILGEPGSGKTTLLLELARDLLARAEKDETHPIPVIFNLSSWAVAQPPITSWLIEELSSKYQVPRRMAREWVKSDQILPLLDGLDEVKPTMRAACVQAINDYRQEHGLLPMVVCSRSTEYLTQKIPMQLAGAIVVQPLTPQQVDDYLESGGEALSALRVALQQDTELHALASTPLMLSIMTLTYHDMPVEQLLRTISPKERQRQVFEHYVERMLQRRGIDSRYTAEQITHWLSWLARQLAQHSQSVFYIERMQPDWLVENHVHHRYPSLVAGLIFGLLGLISLGPLGGPYLANFSLQVIGLQPSFIAVLGFIILFGLISGSLVGLVNAFLYRGEYRGEAGRSADEKKGPWRRIGRHIIRGVLNGLIVGILIGFFPGLLLAHRSGGDELTWGIAEGVLFWLLGALGFGLVDGLLGIQVSEIRPVETFAWSWARMGRNLMKYTFFGLVGSLLFALLIGVISTLYIWIAARPANLLTAFPYALSTAGYALLVTPFVTLTSGLLGGLTGGFSGEILDVRNLTTPNQGIRRSFRHALLVGVAAGLIGFLVGEVGSWLQNPHAAPSTNLTAGLVIGVLVGLISGLRGGGIACLEHLVLRLLLWESGSIPWNYPRFLDYAAERVLLCKVGGGYIFTHRLLLEYFATDEMEMLQPSLQVEGVEVLHRSLQVDAPAWVCECGHREDRSGIRFCPHCGRARA